MNDDVETLRLFINHAILSPTAQKLSDRGDSFRALDRIVVDRDSLRKALDDRWAADLKAAKAIFAETGRTSGFPSVSDVVAWYVAEVERLEKDLSTANQALAERWNEIAFKNMQVCVEATERDRDSLRAKLERAKEAFEDIEEHNANNCNETRLAVRTFLSELSADAPARQTQISDRT